MAYVAPDPYLDDPRKFGIPPAGASGMDPARVEALRQLFGGGQQQDATPGSAPAPDANPYQVEPDQTTQTQHTPTAPGAAPPAPAAPAPAPNYGSAPNSTWHDVQGFLAGFAGPEYLRQFRERDAGLNANAAAAAAKDPNSQQSAAARASAAPFLKRLGFEDADIARLSLADINAGGGLGGFMKQAAALKAEAEKAKESEARQQRMADYTGNTTAGKKERAEIIAGQTLTNQQRMADYNQELKNKGAQPVDLGQEFANLTDAFKNSENGQPPASLVSRLSAIGRLPEDQRQGALISFWKDVESEKNKPKSFSDPLRVEDIEASGWTVGDRGAAERIINKRALTKVIAVQLADAKTSIESLDRLIANREKYGSNASQANQGRAADDRFYFATAKSNYQKAMGIPNTNEGKAEVDHIFAIDPAAVQGTGVAGAIQGAASQVGLAADPVLEQLKTIRDEAAHNMTSKIPIPQLRPPETKIPAWPAQVAIGAPPERKGTPNLGVTAGAGPKVNKVTGAKKPAAGQTARAAGGRVTLPDGSSLPDTAEVRKAVAAEGIEIESTDEDRAEPGEE